MKTHTFSQTGEVIELCQFITSVYCKPAFRGAFYHSDIFLRRGYKINVVPSQINVDFDFPLLFYFLQYGTFTYRD